MNIESLKSKWKDDENAQFKGWDFSYLENRWELEKVPWSYETLIRSHLRKEHHLLDMGTGGGEFLLTLDHPYENTSVTESWNPNYELCIKTLACLGITVRAVSDDSNLPFEDNSFDVIINKHESYDISEVKRILKNGGVFLTQQVGSKNNEKLSQRLIKDFIPETVNHNLKSCVNELRNCNFEIFHEAEYFPYIHFFDLGALVYFARVIEWEFPGFSVDSHFSQLCDLQKDVDKLGFIKSLEHRFIIASKNHK